jgi:signal transduction histidine kinase
MSTPELDDPRSESLLARLRVREEHAEFLSSASELLMRTCKLVSSGRDEESTLISIARLVFPRPGVWSVLEIREGLSSRRIGASDKASAAQPGSVLTVRLSAGDEVLGTLTFLAPLGGHVFDVRDGQLAKDVATGASLAIVNSRREAVREESREAARRAAAERRALISSVSHGLRTPLHAIHGYAQLLDGDVRGPLNDGQRHDVHRIQANERHLLELVNSVIGYARWDDGEQLALEDISVRTAVRYSEAIVKRAAQKTGVTYAPDDDDIDAALVVRAEPRRLQEILLQLLLNAVHFSRPRESVIVQALAVGDKVWIRVTDTGIGISKPHLDSMSQSFMHGPGTHGRIENGIGLGLAIAQRLARGMGGELSVVTKQGSGSTFTLALPRGRIPGETNGSTDDR